jgi:hypothetical protein
MNGAPHRAILEISIADDVTGDCIVKFPNHRRSWEWSWMLINLPAAMNRSALNKA